MLVVIGGTCLLVVCVYSYGVIGFYNIVTTEYPGHALGYFLVFRVLACAASAA